MNIYKRRGLRNSKNKIIINLIYKKKYITNHKRLYKYKTNKRKFKHTNKFLQKERKNLNIYIYKKLKFVSSLGTHITQIMRITKIYI